jgi:asparagine synthase (glutamine-hydrolysing)
MCGIAGIVAPKGFDPQTLVRMTQSIDYRGPNGYGFGFVLDDGTSEVRHNDEWTMPTRKPIVGIGNRRLAILDVSAAGSQPMELDGGALIITFNGEIYNYLEIREQLQDLGHKFRTQTDTEVVLRAYQEWGEECLQRFNGMWSFAIWDRRNRRLFCARDRFGVKPFYYALQDGRFYLASEIKQILQASGMPGVANPRTVFHFLEWGQVDHSAETFFEGVQQLPAGHSLTVDLKEPLQPVLRRYWELCTGPEIRGNDDEAIEQFRELFDSAVRLRLRSDVPVGVSLSGGLDSSAVLCKAKKLAPGTQFQTFSACFEEAEIDEREYVAAAVAASGGMGHQTFPQSAEFWNSVQKMTFHLDEPLGTPAAFPQWCVMAEARAHGVPVILGGQGGDEVLCGYRKYHYFYLWELLRRSDPRFVWESIFWASRGTTSHLKLQSAVRYFPKYLQAPFSLTERICTSEFRSASRELKPRLGAAATLAERQKIDIVSTSIPAFLHYEDRNSMAHSVESRLPFLDYRLVEFALRCVPSLKLRNGWSKWILRNALVGTLPEKIRLRKTKLGFHTPENKWVRSGLQNGHRGVWQSSKLRMERFISGPKFRQECGRFLEGDRGALPASKIFRALGLEVWAQVFSVS